MQMSGVGTVEDIVNSSSLERLNKENPFRDNRIPTKMNIIESKKTVDLSRIEENCSRMSLDEEFESPRI